MDKQIAIDIAKPIFENHDIDVLHVTSDGQVFTDKAGAVDHANRTTKDTEVHEVFRVESIPEPTAINAPTVDAPDDDTKKKD